MLVGRPPQIGGLLLKDSSFKYSWEKWVRKVTIRWSLTIKTFSHSATGFKSQHRVMYIHIGLCNKDIDITNGYYPKPLKIP